MKKQITDLTVRTTEICKNEIYATILRFFEKLTDFHVDHSFHIACPILSVRDQPSTTFFSSILTKLSILAECLEDCFALLDGRLKQLSSLTITVFGRNNVDSPMPSFVSSIEKQNLCMDDCIVGLSIQLKIFLIDIPSVYG